MTATSLSDRAIIRLSPLDASEDVGEFLNGLVTNDVARNLPAWAGLLTPQGKALFDFIVWRDGDDLLVDCETGSADALSKRLALYRLRRKIGIARDDTVSVHWSPEKVEGASPDPRNAKLGWRWLSPSTQADESAEGDWRAHRLSMGVTEGCAELGSDQTLWLECNAVELHGVSFSKGCYVGQENTARMNWRQKVNRRLVVVPLDRSDEKRRRVAYPELGLAVDHLRIEDIEPSWTPGWMALA